MIHSVFVSKPNALNPSQGAFWRKLQHILAERDLRPRTLGETDYPNSAPIEAVRKVMAECHGAIVLGLRQLHVVEGVAKAGTTSELRLASVHLGSAWNQIECGMAYMLQLPLLIMKEGGVEEGVFGVGNTDRFIHQVELTGEWLSSPRFLQPFNEWIEEIHKRSPSPLSR
jgi:hypothetical protein